MPKLSILVPVYNVEEFLPLCLETIKNQSFKDFECLLINDGSTDNSLAASGWSMKTTPTTPTV